MNDVLFVDMSLAREDGTVPVWKDPNLTENAGFAWVGLSTLDSHPGHLFKFKGAKGYPEQFFDYPEGGSWHKPPAE